VKVGLFLPISGRAATAETLAEFARQAEAWGFSSLWCADRIVIPWRIETPYPYSAEARFIVPPDRPFLEPLSCLAYLCGVTQRIRLGMSVLVLPYRHPLYWAKIATTIDHLSKGRLVLGVGVGWMAEEFEALGVPFASRGELADEQLRLLEVLWRDSRVTFHGRYYRCEDIAFEPKPLQRPRVPVWVGGEGKRAQRRAALYGDAWFPYFVRTTPAALRARFDDVLAQARAGGREPRAIGFNCCLPIELTREATAREPDRLRGDSEQVCAALREFAAVGVEHVALQFMAPRFPERLEQIERFATEVLPRLAKPRP
jgi:probable F420-dependent oxidoreductase